MTLSEKARNICLDINKGTTKLGDIRSIAKAIKKNQQLAEELWDTAELLPMLLAILIFDTKKLKPEAIDSLFKDILQHPSDERLQLTDWLMANQLAKDKKLISLIQSWQNNTLPLKRRVFWYYQARLRWTGQVSPDNTKELLDAIEEGIAGEEPEVQWAMNFSAAWIGIYDPAYRNQCIAMGEKLGLYKEEAVARNCTPNYLPKFIEMEVSKRNL